MNNFKIFLNIAILLSICIIFNMDYAWAQIREHDPRTSPIPQIEDLKDNATISLQLNYDGRTNVEFKSVNIYHGLGPTNIGKPPYLRVLIQDDYEITRHAFNSWHPLLDHTTSDYDYDHEVLISDNAIGTFAFPFKFDYTTFKLYDIPLNEEIICVNLKPAITQFCDENPNNLQCIMRVNSPVSQILEVDDLSNTIMSFMVNFDEYDPCNEFSIVDVHKYFLLLKMYILDNLH